MAFKLYNIALQLNGDINHVIRMQKVTAAEAAVLLTIHGPDAIPARGIVLLDEEFHGTPRDLREDISQRYATRNVDGETILTTLFGALGQLPTSIEEVVPDYDPSTALASSAKFSPQTEAVLDQSMDELKRALEEN